MPSDNWAARNVLVTGCTGFIASWLTIDLVNRGANVVGIARDKVHNSYLLSSGYLDKITMVYGSVTDYSLVERLLDEYEIDTCFHLAAQAIVGEAHRSPLSTFECNVRGTWTVLEAARNSRMIRRVVVASSDKAYGEKNKLPCEETDSLDAIHPYDVSKSMADLLARTYFLSYGLPVAVTRCANVYGGGDFNYNRIIPGTIRSIMLDEPPIIRSDGTAIRDYMYTADAVNAYLTLANALDRSEIHGQAFNFGTNTPMTALDLVKKIIQLSEKNHLEPKILGKGKLPGEIHAQYLSSLKAKRLLDWSPQYSLERGLSETINWYRAVFNR
jgi:CDP-glucose 4,6-dehydratase